jgi:hypothetical protein
LVGDADDARKGGQRYQDRKSGIQMWAVQVVREADVIRTGNQIQIQIIVG